MAGRALALADCPARPDDDHLVVTHARASKQLEESLGALAIEPSASEIAAIEQALPASEVAGTRYAAPQMQHLDSER